MNQMVLHQWTSQAGMFVCKYELTTARRVRQFASGGPSITKLISTGIAIKIGQIGNTPAPSTTWVNQVEAATWINETI